MEKGDPTSLLEIGNPPPSLLERGGRASLLEKRDPPPSLLGNWAGGGLREKRDPPLVPLVRIPLDDGGKGLRPLAAVAATALGSVLSAMLVEERWGGVVARGVRKKGKEGKGDGRGSGGRGRSSRKIGRAFLRRTVPRGRAGDCPASRRER